MWSLLRITNSLVTVTKRITILSSFHHKTFISVSQRNVLSHPSRNIKTSASFFNDALEGEQVFNVAKNSVPSLALSNRFWQDLQKIHSKMKQHKILSQVEFENVLSAVKSEGNVSSLQGLMLIRCCGGAIPEMQRNERVKLVTDIWKTLQDLKCLLDTSHYNALLTVYLSIEHNFDPVKFLNNMDEAKVTPDKVTYQCLVSHYCCVGDVDNAKKMMNEMKLKNFHLNVDTFNDLILGYARTNSLDSMNMVLDEIRAANFAPDSSTYKSLACGYAINGDKENVIRVMNDAESDGIKLLHKDVLKIIYTLAVNGHSNLVEQVLPKLQFQRSLYAINQCVHAILELVSKGHHKIGFDLLIRMPRGERNSGQVKPSEDLFIRHLVKENLPPDVVIEYCDKLRNAKLNEHALLQAAAASMQFQKTDDAILYLKNIHAQGYVLRPHFFWPILVSKKTYTEKDIYEILKQMWDLGCPADFDTCVNYVFPYIDTSDLCAVVNKFKDMGYDVINTTKALCTFQLMEGNCKVVLDLLEKYPISINFVGLPLRPLSTAFIKSGDTASVLQLLVHSATSSVSSLHNNVNDVHGSFLLELLSTNKCDVAQLESLLTIMKEKDIKISEMSVKNFLKKLGQQGTHSMVSIVTSLMFSEGQAPKITEKTQILEKMSLSELKSYHLQHKTKNDATLNNLHKLLLFHIEHKNLDHVKELITHYDDTGVTYGEETYFALMKLFCNLKDLDKCMHYQKVLYEMFPEYKMSTYWILRLAKLLVYNQKYQDAEKLIRVHNLKLGRTDGKIHTKLIYELLIGLTQSDDVRHPRNFFEMLLQFGYCKAEKMLLGPLVKVYFKRDNLVGAVNEYLRIAKEYGATPCQFLVFKHLIVEEDTERLQKVMDALIQVHGEANALFTLACTFITCGQLTKAKKILETPGLRTTSERIEAFCAGFEEKNEVSELESFLELSKPVLGLNRERMYYQLLKAYVKEENVEKALGVLEQMKKEVVVPSNRTLQLLGNFLQSMKQPVPFTIPSEGNDALENTNFMQMLKKKNVDGALEAYRSKKLSVEQGTVTLQGVCTLIEILLQNNRLPEAVMLSEDLFFSGFYPNSKVSRLMAVKFAEAGDKKSILELEKKLPYRISKNIPFRDYVAVSYVRRGQSEDFLNRLESEVSKYKHNFPAGGLMAILSDSPEMISKVRKLVEDYYQAGSVMPRNVLWAYLMKNKKFEEAQTIFKCTPEMQSHLYFDDVLSHIRIDKDVEVSRMLLNLSKNSELSLRSKGKIFSVHIGVLLSVNSVEEALTSLRESENLIGLTHIRVGVLFRLKHYLESIGKEVPFTIPKYDNVGSNSSSDL